MHYAIIGAGISGLYAAYLLLSASGQATQVTILEASNRIGGRIHIPHSLNPENLANFNFLSGMKYIGFRDLLIDMSMDPVTPLS